jgi:hypothetical protein
LTLDGIPFDVPGDINITINLSPFETEGVPSSGRTMFKMTMRNPMAEGVTLLTDPSEQEVLRGFAERLESFPMAITLADGSVVRTTGRINFENVETESNQSTIQLLPDTSLEAWEYFVAT